MRQRAFALLALTLMFVSVLALPAGAARRHRTAVIPHEITGISDPDLLGESAALQKSQLTDMKDNLHITSIRIDACQEYVQYAGPNDFDWSQYDQLVAEIRSLGLGIDFIIDCTPSWETPSGNLWEQPASPADYAAWAADVAERYGSGGPTVYELWNEPNLTQTWEPAANPAAYTADLQAAYLAIKSVEPSETVISGGLAPAADDSAGDIAPVQFLQSMYADGAKSSMDAVGYHPYSQPALPDTYEAWSGFSQMSATSPSIRSVMTANGDASKQVWITEVGWPTDQASTTGLTGLIAQAEEFSQVNSFAEANAWVGPVYWYTYQDDSTGFFGLITAAGAHKAAYSLSESP